MCLEKDGVVSFFLAFLAAGSFVCLLFSREGILAGFLVYLMFLYSFPSSVGRCIFGGGGIYSFCLNGTSL